jgi:uncharacterized protein
MPRVLPALLVLLFAAALAHASVPFWGAKESLPPETDPKAMKPGQFIWQGDAVTSGPVVVAVSLEDQRATVYRNGVRIGVTTVSTGKKGHATPTGVFTVLQKDKDHRSSIYNSAPMPYTERLTWGGVALHAGGLPGYPSSHGCVHLPSEFARRLFEIAPMGMVVAIADRDAGPAYARHPGAVAPLDPLTGTPVETPRLGPGEEQRWTPNASPSGPVTVIVSGADRRIVVFRSGVEIGRAKFELRDPAQPLGTHAYVLLAPDVSAAAGAAGSPERRWQALALPGHESERGTELSPELRSRVAMPPDFLASVRGVIEPGATILVTDQPVLGETTGVPMTIVSSDPPAAAAEGPSFDCKASSAPIAALICKDADLAALDQKLAGVVAEARAKAQAGAVGAAQLDAEQASWAASRDACWKSDDARACVISRYSARTAELQTRWDLAPHGAPVTYVCDGVPPTRIIATFYESDPPAATFEHAGARVVGVLAPTASGARYVADGGISFWSKGDEATVQWPEGNAFGCRTGS